MTKNNYSLIKYPWKDFLDGKEGFNLFGYGSLINEFSSKRTIKNSNELIPVNAFGIKRVLNYDPDENVRSRSIYSDPERGDEYFGVFNIQYTGVVEDYVNGVLRRVSQFDFENLVTREVGYSLVKVRYVPFNDPQARFADAYVLVAPEEFNGRKLINNNLLPNVPYYKICREGAKNISLKFLEEWLNTSYLGDGRTVREWENEEGLF